MRGLYGNKRFVAARSSLVAAGVSLNCCCGSQKNMSAAAAAAANMTVSCSLRFAGLQLFNVADDLSDHGLRVRVAEFGGGFVRQPAKQGDGGE